MSEGKNGKKNYNNAPQKKSQKQKQKQTLKCFLA